MKLINVEILKFKSFQTSQKFDIEKDVTILVGMNESGKTSALEAIAKTNYFQNDNAFKFNPTHDFPRKEKKKMDKSGIIPEAVICTYEISKDLKEEIEAELGKETFESNEFSVTTKYDNSNSWSIVKINRRKFVENLTTKLGISSKVLNDKLEKIQSKEEFEELQVFSQK